MGYVCEKTKAEQRELGRGAYLKCSYTKVLGLSLAEGVVYAVVRSFSEKYRDGFTGSRSYISDITGVSLRVVASALSSLVRRGLVTKKYVTVNNCAHPAYFSDGSLEEKLVAQYLDGIEAESIGAGGIENTGIENGGIDAGAEGAQRSDEVVKKREPWQGEAAGNNCARSEAKPGCDAAGNSCTRSEAKPDSDVPRDSAEEASAPARGFVIGEGETGYVAQLRPRVSDKPQRSVKYFSRGNGDEVTDAMLRALERTYAED